MTELEALSGRLVGAEEINRILIKWFLYNANVSEMANISVNEALEILSDEYCVKRMKLTSILEDEISQINLYYSGLLERSDIISWAAIISNYRDGNDVPLGDGQLQSDINELESDISDLEKEIDEKRYRVNELEKELRKRLGK